VTPQSDLLLLPLLRAAHEPEAESLLAQLIAEHAAPIIKGIIKSKLHATEQASYQEAEDLYGEVVVQLLTRLRAFVADPEANHITDFRGYVAVITYNTFHHYLRRKYPARWRLKNRLRYLLTHRGDFALWDDGEGDLLCGFAVWRARGKEAARAWQLRQFADAPESLKHAGAEGGQSDLAELLSAVFKFTGAPVRIEDLLSTVADLLDVRESVAVQRVAEDEVDGGEVDLRVSFATETERRSYLRRLWVEITQLPPMQRAALLLNLRDTHEGVITLLPLAGVASLREIAEAVAMPAEQFAQLWNDLPLDDLTIAGLLNVTRQQVINLRKSARARLGRRMNER